MVEEVVWWDYFRYDASVGDAVGPDFRCGVQKGG
jgi:hypothetical protein